MDSHPKVSICVPVYNVEKYLPKCLDSLCQQTFEDIEIILVNDASSDNSEAIILEYAEKDSRIHYIKHEVNQLLPQARQTAIKAARGEYLTFVDSDDWVDKNFVELLYHGAIVNQADMVICGFKRLVNDELHSIYNPAGMRIDMLATVSFVNKLFSRKLFEDLDFEIINVHTGEDFRVVPLIYKRAKKVIRIEESPYNYRYVLSKWESTPEILESRLLPYEYLYTYFYDKKDFSAIAILQFYLTILLNKSYRYYLKKKDRSGLMELYDTRTDITSVFYDRSMISRVGRTLLRSVLGSSLGFKICQFKLIREAILKPCLILFNLRYWREEIFRRTFWQYIFRKLRQKAS